MQDRPEQQPALSGTTENESALPYRQVLQDVVAALGTDGARGLGEAEAMARLKRDCLNELAPEPPVPKWRMFGAQFTGVLVILLLIATAVSATL